MTKEELIELADLVAEKFASKMMNKIYEDKRLMRLDYESWHKKVYGYSSLELAKIEQEETKFTSEEVQQ